MKVHFYFPNFIGFGIGWRFAPGVSVVSIRLPFLIVVFEKGHLSHILDEREL
jgi:hypothetical protein